MPTPNEDYSEYIKLTINRIALLFFIQVIIFLFLLSTGRNILKISIFCSCLFLLSCVFCIDLLIHDCSVEYHDSHPEKYYGGDVYRFNLMSIKPDITVYNDWTKAKNILESEKQVVDTVMVQFTCSDKYYREIITGKLIPVSKVGFTDDMFYFRRSRAVEYYNLDPYMFIYEPYVIDSVTKKHLVHPKNSKHKVSPEELEQYIKERKNGYKGFDSYGEYLDSMYKQAEGYYEEAKGKNNISDEKKIQLMLENI